METYRPSGASDLVAITVCRFGFIPRNSVAIHLFAEAGSQKLGKCLRLDLDQLSQIPAALRQFIAEGEPFRGIIVVFDGDRAKAERAAFFASQVIAVEDAGYTDLERFWSLSEASEDKGEPVVLDSHPLVARFVLEGKCVLRSREEIANEYIPETAQVIIQPEQIAKANSEALEGARDWVCAASALMVRGIAGESLDDEQIAHLVAASHVTPARDFLWLQISNTNGESAARFWASVAQRTPRAQAAPALSLAAFSAWVSGDGTHALIAAEHALEIVPDYSMARLLLSSLEIAMDPRIWQGFGVDQEEVLAMAESAIEAAS